MERIFQILIIAFLLEMSLSLNSQGSQIQDIQYILPAIERIDHLIDLSEQYADQLKSDSAYLFAQRAINVADDHSLQQKKAEAYYALGYAYDLSGELDEALHNYENARASYEILDIKEEVATCMNSKGVASYFKGDFELALGFYLKTLDYTEQHNIKSVMANTLNNLGVIYRVTNKNREAIDIYYKTLKLSKDTDNQNMVGTSYHNLGVAYNFESSLDTALIYFDSAVIHYSKLNDFFEIGRIMTAIGEAYYFTGRNYSQARKFLKKGEEYLHKVQTDQEVLSKTYLLRAQVDRDDYKYKSSINYFKKGLQLVENTERKELLLDFFKEIETLYNQMGDAKNAHLYLTKYVSLYKEIQNIEKLSAIEELQTKYETEQKVQEIHLLNNEKALSQAKLTGSRRFVTALIFGIIIMSLFLYWFNILNKKLKNSADEKDTLLREIHHRVKNNLQVISALLTLQSSYVKDDQAIEALREGQDRVQSMALIHKDLYQHDNLKGVNTKDYLDKLVDNLVASYSINTDQIELETDIESLWLDVDTMIPMGLMINELISNALKHAFTGQENGKLKISLQENNGVLKLIISDNGKGASDFEQERKKSFGYSLINSFAKKLNADINYIHKDGLTIEMEIKEYVKAA